MGQTLFLTSQVENNPSEEMADRQPSAIGELWRPG